MPNIAIWGEGGCEKRRARTLDLFSKMWCGNNIAVNNRVFCFDMVSEKNQQWGTCGGRPQKYHERLENTPDTNEKAECVKTREDVTKPWDNPIRQL